MLLFGGCRSVLHDLLVFLVGVFLELSNLLLQLGGTVVFIPLLLGFDLLKTVVEVLVDGGCGDVEERELLDDNDIKVKRVIVLDLLLLFLSLLLSGSTNGQVSSSFTLSLSLADLDFAVSELSVNLSLDLLFLKVSLGLTGNGFVIDDKASSHLEGVEVANKVLTAFDLLSEGMGEALDLLITLFLTFSLVSSTFNDSVLLALLPFDVHDFFSLLLEVVSALPVGLSLLILGSVEFADFFLDFLNLLGDLVGSLSGFVLLSVGQFQILADELHLLVKDIFLLLVFADLAVELLLLRLKLLDCRLDLLVATCLGDRVLQNVDLLDKFAFSLGGHGSRSKLSVHMLDLLVDVLNGRAIGVH